MLIRALRGELPSRGLASDTYHNTAELWVQSIQWVKNAFIFNRGRGDQPGLENISFSDFIVLYKIA